MAEFFSDYDFIVTPDFMSVAPPVTQDLYDALPYGDPVGAVRTTHHREQPEIREGVR